MSMVSVIIPYYNREDTLLRALDSVLNQTYDDFEIVLVNDGSTDRSEEVVDEYIKDHPKINFKHIIQSNAGPSSARNEGILKSTGKYIAFLDSDDAWEPQKIQKQIEYMELNSEVAITGTNYSIVKADRWDKYPLNPPVVETSFYRMLFKVAFITPTVVIRRQIFFDDNIWFKVSKDQGEDQSFFLQIIRRYRGVRLSLPLASLFKLEYGEGISLTSNITKLFISDLDNIKILYGENDECPEKRINISLYVVLIGYYFLKHCKRVLRMSYHRLKIG